MQRLIVKESLDSDYLATFLFARKHVDFIVESFAKICDTKFLIEPLPGLSPFSIPTRRAKKITRNPVSMQEDRTTHNSSSNIFEYRINKKFNQTPNFNSASTNSSRKTSFKRLVSYASTLHILYNV